MKKEKIILLIILLLIAASPAITVFAQYKLLEPLPGLGGVGPFPTTITLKELLSWIFRFMIALAGILAVLMLVYAGILYITSGGNASRAENAKSKITSALLGLMLAIAAYIILNVINPNLVNLDLIFPTVTDPDWFNT